MDTMGNSPFMPCGVLSRMRSTVRFPDHPILLPVLNANLCPFFFAEQNEPPPENEIRFSAMPHLMWATATTSQASPLLTYRLPSFGKSHVLITLRNFEALVPNGPQAFHRHYLQKKKVNILNDPTAVKLYRDLCQLREHGATENNVQSLATGCIALGYA